MSQEQFWILLSKKIAGEASEKELAELEFLLQQHPEWQFAAQNLRDMWVAPAAVDTADEEDAYLLHVQRMKELGVDFRDNVLYAYTAEELQPVKHIHSKRKWYIAAAVAASLAGIFFLLTPLFRQGNTTTANVKKQQNEVSTNHGSRTKINLPDGSIVWLNAGSKINYDENYGISERNVTLSGEAFFDVVKNKEKPFIIHTSNIDVKVLGTVFNVKAYPNDATTETSLIQGLVEVTIKNRENDKIILKPNEKLIVDNNSAPFIQGKGNTLKPEHAVLINQLKPNRIDSTINEIQWVQNRLVFDDEPLQEIALRMERWYNVKIEIKSDRLLHKRISGSFVNENLDQAMEALSATGRFRYKRLNDSIIINP